jgi:hypothetical protein
LLATTFSPLALIFLNPCSSYEQFDVFLKSRLSYYFTIFIRMKNKF